ncbi:hypothetical protein ACFLT8_06795 [Chloroflexota bacterium]
MGETISIGLIGDADETRRPRISTDTGIRHAADFLSIKANITWIPTKSIVTGEEVKKFDGVWGAPGGAYQSWNGAIKGIQFARENDQPFLGT